MKILPVGAEFPHEDGRTDGHDEGNNRFSPILRKLLKTVRSVIVLLQYKP